MILILVSGKYQVQISNRLCVAEALICMQSGFASDVFQDIQVPQPVL